MPTKSDIIKSALRKLGVTGFDSETDPQEFDAALVELESMMTEWDGRGIRVSYKLGTSTDTALTSEDAGIRDWARQGIVANLAMRLATDYGKPITQDLAMQASAGMSSILAATATDNIYLTQYPRNMPVGSGNRNIGNRQRFYRPVEGITVENGGELDL